MRGACDRLLRSLILFAFVGLQYVYIPLHLLTEDHDDVHCECPVDSARHHGLLIAAGSEQEPSHPPHPGSDHELTGVVVRLSASVAPLRILLEPSHAASPEPDSSRSGQLASAPSIEPWPPPLASPLQPRAPPVA